MHKGRTHKGRTHKGRTHKGGTHKGRTHKGRIYNERKVYEEPPHMRLPARFSVGNEAGERGCLDTRLQGIESRILVSRNCC